MMPTALAPRSPRIALVTSLIAASLLVTGQAAAATAWTDWTSATAGAPGSASGSVGGVSVGYSGELDGAVINGFSTIWSPNSSFVAGVVTASPSTVGDDLRLNGSFTGTNTISFSTPVVNPVFAIWSLGSPSIPASFIFTATPTLIAGGPNSQYGGQSITVSGNTVSGREGNGVVQFAGTFSSLSWTNTPENFYAFSVGINGATVPGVPEPSTTALLAVGMAALVAWRRRNTNA